MQRFSRRAGSLPVPLRSIPSKVCKRSSLPAIQLSGARRHSDPSVNDFDEALREYHVAQPRVQSGRPAVCLPQVDETHISDERNNESDHSVGESGSEPTRGCAIRNSEPQELKESGASMMQTVINFEHDSSRSDSHSVLSWALFDRMSKIHKRDSEIKMDVPTSEENRCSLSLPKSHSSRQRSSLGLHGCLPNVKHDSTSNRPSPILAPMRPRQVCFLTLNERLSVWSVHSQIAFHISGAIVVSPPK